MSPSALQRLPLDCLRPHPGDPFHPYADDKLRELAASLARHGQLHPICVRPARDEGHFEILSGKNRVSALRLNGSTEADALVLDADDDTAVLILTDSNLKHRETLLPSERAFAYRLQMDALKRQGKRNDLTDMPEKIPLTAETVAERYNISKNTVKRHIRLTYLIPEFLQLVDGGILPLFVGVDLSYIDEESQRVLYMFVCPEHIASLDLGKARAIKQTYRRTRMPFTLQVMQHLFRPPRPRPLSISRRALDACTGTLPDDAALARLFMAFVRERYATD